MQPRASHRDADPALRKENERDGQHKRGGGKMHADGVQVHPGDQRKQEQAGRERDHNRFEMVIVKRSLDAAKAISAGKRNNLIASAAII